MLEAIGNALRIPELRRKILFTLGLFLVFRILAHIAVPGADKAALDKLFNSNAFLGLLDLFSGAGSRPSRSSPWGSTLTSTPRSSCS